MTMSIEVKNTSENYVGKVFEMDRQPGDTVDTIGGTYELKPGESKELYVWDDRYLVVQELGEVPSSV